MSADLSYDVTVVVCTRKRPELVKKCLESILAQKTEIPFDVVVVENDDKQESKEIVDDCIEKAQQIGLEMRYFCEPEQNIALARNRGIRECRGEFVLFIDDDETAAPDWIEKMVEIQKRTDADVVQGTCEPIFPDDFPELFRHGSIYSFEAFSEECVRVPGVTTNTTLYRLSALAGRENPLDPAYGTTGGSDFELSLYLDGIGKSQYKTALAKVYEFQPLKRASFRFFTERNFRETLNTYRAIRQHCGRMGGLRFLLRRLNYKFKGIFNALVRFPFHPAIASLQLSENFAGLLGLFCALFGFQKRGYR